MSFERARRCVEVLVFRCREGVPPAIVATLGLPRREIAPGRRIDRVTIFENSAFDEHEQVGFVRDSETGLRCIIAIHSTALGPAGGGIRMFPYPDSNEALRDVLRLSRAMTYKSALAGLPVGGGSR